MSLRLLEIALAVLAWPVFLLLVGLLVAFVMLVVLRVIGGTD